VLFPLLDGHISDHIELLSRCRNAQVIVFLQLTIGVLSLVSTELPGSDSDG